ncbi:hypothetical protein Tco_1001895 [Tanacetum coccineum]
MLQSSHIKTQGRYDDNLMFDTGVLDNEQDMIEKEVDMVEKDVSTADPVTTAGEVVTTTTTTVDELTLAQTLIEIKAAKPKGLKGRTILQRLRSKEQKRKPPTKVSKEKYNVDLSRKIMADTSTNQLKTKIFEDVQISKRAGEELESENLKKQKLDENVKAEVDDDKKEAEMKKHVEIVLDDEVAIDAITLATKPPIIVDWKIIKEGKIGYFQIIRADGSSRRTEEAYERVLWGDLKVMFEPDVESYVWRHLQGHKVIVWKLFSSSVVHFVRFQNLHIFMLVEKKYPLTPTTITTMFNKKLQADHWNEMCYQLLKLMTKLVKNPGSGRIVGIKRLYDDLRVNTDKVRVTAAKHNLVLPKIEEKDHFELKGQFLKELRDNTFSGSDNEDANEHIEKVLEIVDLFHIPNITQDQEVISFYKGLDVPTRHIIDSKGAIPSMKAVDAKKAIQDMADHSQKWNNRMSTRCRSTKTSNGLVAIQAQLNNLGKEIKKVNEKVYTAQVGCELCKVHHYTKDCPLKEEGKTLEEAYYTQFGVPFQQGGQYRAVAPGDPYHRNKGTVPHIKDEKRKQWKNRL